MATQEYLLRYIYGGKVYQELPARLKLAVSEEEWARKVKAHCVGRGSPWAGSPAARVCTEPEYYDALLDFYRTHQRLYPYHLGDYLCRVLRVTPFRYYRGLLADAMREDRAYDAIPNFTAADIVRCLGIGRNKYIAVVQQAKSKKLLWRVSRDVVSELLPHEPLDPEPEPWWLAHCVNLGDVEYRQLAPREAAACHAAAARGGARCADLDAGTVLSLYRRGLLWFEVPVEPDDQLSIPPLEGFVSNRSAAAAGEGGAVDPLEVLLYKVFVAASESVTVAQLATILAVDLGTLRTAISMACRLRFCRKLQGPAAGPPSAAASPGRVPLAGAPRPSPQHPSDLDSVLSGSADAVVPPGTPAGPGPCGQQQQQQQQQPPPGAGWQSAAGSRGGVALVVDSEVTGYLMMGALTPGCKKHSVTLFEGGRVYGAEVIAELVSELRASVGMAAGYEGEMAALVDYARSLVAALDCVRASGGGRAIELLRKESMEAMPAAAAFRILAHSYSVVLPVAPLPSPPLPLSLERAGPANYGPIPAACTPWLQLALYAAAERGPPSLVLPAGRRLLRLPPLLQACDAALVWAWDCQAVRAPQGAPLVLPADSLLATLNQFLGRTAIMVQPQPQPQQQSQPELPASPASPGSAAADASTGERRDAAEQPATAPTTLDIPLPLPALAISSGAGAVARRPTETTISTTSSGGGGGGADWANFDLPDDAALHLGAAPGNIPHPCTDVSAFTEDGGEQQVRLPLSCVAALGALGLSGALGALRVVCSGGRCVPLQLTLGLPLQPPALCQAVCDAAAAVGFLDGVACAAHTEGQRALRAALDALAGKYGVGSARHGPDADLSPAVAFPVCALETDAEGRLRVADLSTVLQGLPGVLG